MKILACDTSNSTCCAGIYDGDKVYACELCTEQKTHSETFMPMVHRVVEASGLSYDDIDAFAVTVGPGSFTGIRIGLSAVKGMAYAANKKVIPVSSTLALSMSCEIADDMGRNTYFIPSFDARNDRVFAQMTNARTHDSIVEEGAYDAFVLTKTIKNLVKSTKPRLIVLGSGAPVIRNHFEEAGIRAEYATGAVILASGVAKAAELNPTLMDGGAVTATYCAKAQAERLKK